MSAAVAPSRKRGSSAASERGREREKESRGYNSARKSLHALLNAKSIELPRLNVPFVGMYIRMNLRDCTGCIRTSWF